LHRIALPCRTASSASYRTWPSEPACGGRVEPGPVRRPRRVRRLGVALARPGSGRRIDGADQPAIYIPRNHLVEEALTAATAGDQPARATPCAVASPYDERRASSATPRLPRRTSAPTETSAAHKSAQSHTNGEKVAMSGRHSESCPEPINFGPTSRRRSAQLSRHARATRATRQRRAVD
jgi:hypothetical protein